MESRFYGAAAGATNKIFEIKIFSVIITPILCLMFFDARGALDPAHMDKTHMMLSCELQTKTNLLRRREGIASKHSLQVLL